MTSRIRRWLSINDVALTDFLLRKVHFQPLHPKTMSTRKSKWESDEEEAAPSAPTTTKRHKKTSTEKKHPSRHASPSISHDTSKTKTPALTQPMPRRSTSRPFIASCRSVDRFERLNRIEEGSYGIVFRARDRDTGDVVALKKLKLDKEKNGFPVTSLREIYTLINVKHPNIVNVREIVMGNHLDQ